MVCRAKKYFERNGVLKTTHAMEKTTKTALSAHFTQMKVSRVDTSTKPGLQNNASIADGAASPSQARVRPLTAQCRPRMRVTVKALH